jgi:uncharacterized protein
VIVVSDTSVLINLCRVGRGNLLKALFHEVVIPPEVAEEFARLATMVPRFGGLALPDGIRQQTPSTLIHAASGLDAGETAALSLALEIRADAILVDERRGHDAAVELGLRTIGILGILLQAKNNGMLPMLRPVLDSLQRDAGFWMSASLREQILRLVGEF